MRLQYTIVLILLLFLSLNSQAQDKKVMDHSVYSDWKKISAPAISNDGEWIHHLEVPGHGDSELKIRNIDSEKSVGFPRAKNAKFSHDSKFVIFQLSLSKDSLRSLKLDKVKSKDLPKDSIAIYDLEKDSLIKFPEVKSYKIAKDKSNLLAFLMEPQKAKKDTTIKVKPKEESKKNGSKLVLIDLTDFSIDTVGFVKSYLFSEEGDAFVYHTTGADSLDAVHYLSNSANSFKKIYEAEAKIHNLAFDKKGDQLVFLVDQDSSKNKQRKLDLYHYRNNYDVATKLVSHENNFKNESWEISTNYQVNFSENGQKLFFGVAPPPIEKDTSLLDEEIAQVEVWATTDPLLHTQQESRKSSDEKKSYLCVYHFSNGSVFQLADTDMPYIILDRDKNATNVLGYSDEAYLQNISWLGYADKDLYLLDLEKNERKLIMEAIQGSPRISPNGKYASWYSRKDSVYMIYSFESGQVKNLTTNVASIFWNEKNDVPAHPSPYGMAGWTKDDAYALIYDQFDIWKFDPSGSEEPQRLTDGREKLMRCRLIQLDLEKQFYDLDEKQMLYVFNTKTKDSGYASLENSEVTGLKYGAFQLQTRPIKAKDADRLIYTEQNFRTFPDLLVSDLTLENVIKCSDVNPQQSEYRWGNIQLYSWRDDNGKERSGMLLLPEYMEPNKKYPVIVNFYERSSDGLHRHRTPEAHRSTINYSYYVNQGYIIFNPDIEYTVGYPGKSCLDIVTSGVKSLLQYDFVDEERIGLQGHSWGGYQIAHIVTKTNMFKCAESGAPVVNMTSAYGGIRWRTGMSRMFQYEKTQSRIGTTLWENTDLYLENSPLFNVDKIKTPLLILHNDKDGAVPWYQGIEFFVALRRLGKTAWLLNYNNEPHWPLKWQNRLDFNIRMQQFFDHYLKGEKQPQWMIEGVSARNKGINQGLGY